MRQTVFWIVLSLVVGAGGARGETISTFALDGLSFFSFQDEETLPISGTLRFRFGDQAPDGSIPFSISPEDVSIAEISLSGGRTLRYSLASATSGALRPGETGSTLGFHATVVATLVDGEDQGARTYSIAFTTETASARTATKEVSVRGARMAPSSRYLQLVGATVNKSDAVPRPGAAVYTVLSGTFDRLP